MKYCLKPLTLKSLLSVVGCLGLLVSGFETRSVLANSISYPSLPLAGLSDHGFKEAAFRRFEDYVFSEEEDFTTDAIVVVHQGKIVFERYSNGYTAEMKHHGWSLTKSVLTALVGVSEKEGKLSRSDRVTKFFPDYSKTPWIDVKVDHLLSMSSGLDWNEGYETSPFQSHVVAMLYRFPMMADMATYRLRQMKKIAHPGNRLNYSSGDSNLLSKILKRSWGESYQDFPWKKFFYLLKTNFTMEIDMSGTFVGSSYAYATPRDWAKFGQLYLQNGVMDGVTFFPHDWVRLSQTPSSALLGVRADHSPKNQAYGHGFWLNRSIPDALVPRKIQSASDDLYWAQGHDGQYIFIWPTKNLVLVRMGRDRYSQKLDLNRFFYLLGESLP